MKKEYVLLNPKDKIIFNLYLELKKVLLKNIHWDIRLGTKQSSGLFLPTRRL
jgi:hypothetical protein